MRVEHPNIWFDNARRSAVRWAGWRGDLRPFVWSWGHREVQRQLGVLIGQVLNSEQLARFRTEVGNG